MTRLIPNKLQTQRNFPSIWHSQPELISTFLREDEILRNYITGTMKSYQWKVSEIIIKRRVAGLHIVFQTQYRRIKIRRFKTKNRKKNRYKYLEYLKRIRAIKKKSLGFRPKLLYNLISILTCQLKKLYPNDRISFYVQRVQVLHFNTQFINQWMSLQFNKKRSYHRSIFRVIKFFRINSTTLTQSKWSTIETLWWRFKAEEKKILMSWLSSNLFHLYHLFGGHNLSPQLKTRSNYQYASLDLDRYKKPRHRNTPWMNLPGEIWWQKFRPFLFPRNYYIGGPKFGQPKPGSRNPANFEVKKKKKIKSSRSMSLHRRKSKSPVQ